jgi:hypothetical protein
VAPRGKQLIVPIAVKGIADRGIISYQFDLKYDPAVIQPEKDSVDFAGTVSRGLSVVANAGKPGILRIVVYGPIAIESDGVLLNLIFTAVGATGSASPLTFERIVFGEDGPEAAATDGLVELSNE